jgi:hypothetical protein
MNTITNASFLAWAGGPVLTNYDSAIALLGQVADVELSLPASVLRLPFPATVKPPVRRQFETRLSDSAVV